MDRAGRHIWCFSTVSTCVELIRDLPGIPMVKELVRSDIISSARRGPWVLAYGQKIWGLVWTQGLAGGHKHE
jgi:hypothetical protein